jgi:arginine/ornithine transport system permease protein
MTESISLIFDSVLKMLAGLGMTSQLLFISSGLGLILAVTLLLMRISGKWYLNLPAQAYIYIFRGTPILVQIFIIYYGLPQFEFIRNSIFWPILREGYGCAIVALFLNSGAYTSEILRGGVLAVDQGYLEAASALGLSKRQRLIHIIAPIATRISIPAYSNEFISMLKSTALASTITVADMTGIGRTIVAETFAPYEIFISLAIIYMILTFFIQRGFGWVENLLSRYTKKLGNN